MKTKFLVVLALMALATGCTDVGVIDNSVKHDAAMDPGKDYSERTVSVNRNGKDGGQVTLRFYDDLPNVAYIAATSYYRMMLPDATMRVVNLGDRYLLTASGYSATVDVVNDMLTSTAYNDFVSLQSLIGPGLPSFETCYNPFLKYDSHQYDPAGATVTLNFKKYGIDLHDDGQEVYFPFSTINDMFDDANIHMACYNGSNILVNAGNSVYDLAQIDKDYATPAYTTVEVAEDLAAYRYRELCFVIDHFYGYPNRNILEKQGLREQGLDATLDVVSGGKDVKSLLQSQNQAKFVVGTEALNHLLYDGGHTCNGLMTYAPEAVREAFTDRYKAALSSATDNVRQMVEAFYKTLTASGTRATELNAKRDKSFGDNLYVKSKDGQTAVFVMTSFMDLNTDGWQAYYASNHTADDWKKLVEAKTPDLLVQTVEVLKRARQEGVRNLVFDVSLNGGGEDDPTTAIVALLGDKTATLRTSRVTSSWEMDMLTRQHLTKNFLVDRNFDGTFDEQDDRQDWVGDMNIAVLTSGITFSNASVFTAKMKDYGYPIWGQQSGGGACSIQRYVTPDGMCYTISSSRSHSTDRSKQSIDGGTHVDKQLTNEQLYDVEYLNSLFR